MNPLSNPPYLLPPLVVLAVSLILIMVVWRGTRWNFTSCIFCGLLLSIGLWSLLIFGMRSSPNVHRAFLWDRMLPAVSYATAVLYYHFTLTYTHTRGQRRILLLCYLLLALFAGLSPTGLLIQGMRLEYYGYAPITGPLLLPLIFVSLFLLGRGTYNLLKRYNASHSHDERNRILYFLIAVFFLVLGGLLDGLSNLPPVSIWSNLIFCILCSIAMLRYHLLDIHIVVRKGLVYLLTSLAVSIPYVGLLYLLHYIFEPALEPWWIHVFIILLLAVLLRPLYSQAQNLVDRLFYRDRYDYLRALQRFAHQTQSVLNLEELSSNMIQLVGGALRSSSVCLLLPSEGKGSLGVVSCTGLESPPSGVVLRSSSPLVKWLERHGDIVSSEQLNIIPQLQSISIKEKNNVERMGAELYVPIKSRQGQLSGILVLGQKLSQQSYSNEERQLLKTLSSQMAMALENAWLYDSERTMRKELEKLDEQKTEFLHSVGHELKTPLTAIISSSELMSEGSSIARSLRERLINNIRESAWSMDRKVAELLDLARMQIGELKIEIKPLEMGRVITEVASQLHILFEKKEQTLTLEIPDSLPKVNADREKLEQVLFNLLSNANKFSPSGSNVILRAREVDRRIIVEVEDAAPAVTKEDKKKLFDPYYRGEDADKRQRFSGLGLGLAISRRLVELHQGEIWVESKPTKGNTFAFSLPVVDQGTNGIR